MKDVVATATESYLDVMAFRNDCETSAKIPRLDSNGARRLLK